MNRSKINERHTYTRDLVNEYDAEGVIFENMKFCEFWAYEKVLAPHVLSGEMGIPCCTIERDYTDSSAGQTRTRIQAFVESLEMGRMSKVGGAA